MTYGAVQNVKHAVAAQARRIELLKAQRKSDFVRVEELNRSLDKLIFRLVVIQQEYEGVHAINTRLQRELNLHREVVRQLTETIADSAETATVAHKIE
jgi:malonyl CoA-acyl carrier protein transacylase